MAVNEGIKRGKDVNKNVAERTRHKEYADVSFGKCLASH